MCLNVFTLLLFLSTVHLLEATKPTAAQQSTAAGVIKAQRIVATKKFCRTIDQALKAKHMSCFLRPDTGPCRADIIQWYFDVRQRKCFRFFWGGCQGNGNRFNNGADCFDHCYLNESNSLNHIPYFCNLPFDFGTCYGHYYRWGWDPLSGICKRYLYSGCGGNQNNFQVRDQCTRTCLQVSDNSDDTMNKKKFTTCIPIVFDESNE